VTLSQVSLSGTGIGLVGYILQTSIAPVQDSLSSVPSALYQTNPPVFFSEDRMCHVQTLFSVRGYVLHGHDHVRVWVIVRFDQLGRFRLDGYEVSYSANGKEGTQWLPYAFATSVAAGAEPHPPENWEQPCLDRTQQL
jgi:hypothetical protein